MPYLGASGDVPGANIKSYRYKQGTDTSTGATSFPAVNKGADELRVYLNGALLKLTDDYTFTTSAVTISPAPADDDEIQIDVYTSMNLADTVSSSDGGNFVGAVTFQAGVKTGSVKAQDGTSAITIADSTGKVTIPGDLEIQGTTTTIDTNVESVDKLEVGANSTDYAVKVNQTGTGNLLQLQDSGTDAFVVKDGGNVEATGIIKADDIQEKTSAHGVEIDGVTLKDGGGTFTGNVVIPDSGNIGSASDTDAITIDSSGNVGIGISGPDAITHLVPASGSKGLRIDVPNGSTAPATQIRYNGATKIELKADGDSHFNGGNVGIGTTDPNGKVTSATAKDSTALAIVNTTATTLGTEKNYISFYGTNNSSNLITTPLAQIGAQSNNGSYQQGDLIFYTSPFNSSSTERMRISSSGSITTPNGQFDGEIGASATFASALFNKGTNGYVILPSGIEIKWGLTSTISSFGDGNSTTHTYTSDQGGAFGTATLWGMAWIADRTTCPNITGGTSGVYNVDDSASSITIYGGTGSTASNVKLGFMAIGH